MPKTNRQNIYSYLYRRRGATQQEIIRDLGLSRPTVLNNLSELETEGCIQKAGTVETEGAGRPAMTYSVVADDRFAIGAELMADRVKLIAIDLYGEPIGLSTKELLYRNDEEYYRAVCDYVERFLTELSVPTERLLGVGIAIQGLVSPDGTTVVYGEILGCTGLSIDVFTRHLPYPCRFVHDPDGAAASELWHSPDLKDAVYLSLSGHLGGAMITDRQIRRGRHGHMATFEHMCVRPGGKLCYCGKRGCAETICSSMALLGNEDPEDFFGAVRVGAENETARWETYLEDLGSLIAELHLMQDVPFVLGGHLAPYFTGDDVAFLYEKVRESCPFEEEEDYLLISKNPSHNITIGAALPFVRSYLEEKAGE